MNLKDKIRDFDKILEITQRPWILILAVVYVLGYLIWSYYAWKYDIGIISIASLQYLLAGMPVLLIILLLYLFNSLIEKLYKVIDLYPKLNLAWQIVLPIISYFIGLLAWIFAYLILFNGIAGFKWIYLLYILGFAIILPFTSSPIHSHFSFSILRLKFLVITVYLILFLLFVDKIYYKIPMEFGGLRPKIISLSIQKNFLDKSILNSFAVQDSSGKDMILIKNAKLIFQTDNSFYLELSRMNNTQALEIPKSHINYVIWNFKHRELTEIIRRTKK